MIHAMIRVLDLERSLNFYRDALGLHVAQKVDFPDFALVYLRNPENDFELELTLNKGRTEPYTHGTGHGHVAVCVDDLDTERAGDVVSGTAVHGRVPRSRLPVDAQPGHVSA